MGNEKLIIKNLSKEFQGISVVEDVSFSIASGELVVVMGRSGCGKSTLLYCISGMDRPTSGEVQLEGRELTTLSDREMETLRLERMGFIFQKANFLKNFSILDNILFPAFQLGKQSRKEILHEAEQTMERLGIWAIANHDIRQVSGGQLQRAAICRAMINRPSILFGDEPTGALNSSATQEVMDIMTGINRGGTTILLVTHDAKVAARADRVIYLEDGRIKDVLVLGKYEENSGLIREQQMKEWLEKMNF